MGSGSAMGAFSVIFGSMVIVALVYVILHNSSGFSTVLKGAGSSYAKTAHTFEGG